MNLVNRIQELFMSIIQTVFFCFFQNTSPVDPGSITTLPPNAQNVPIPGKVLDNNENIIHEDPVPQGQIAHVEPLVQQVNENFEERGPLVGQQPQGDGAADAAVNQPPQGDGDLVGGEAEFEFEPPVQQDPPLDMIGNNEVEDYIRVPKQYNSLEKFQNLLNGMATLRYDEDFKMAPVQAKDVQNIVSSSLPLRNTDAAYFVILAAIQHFGSNPITEEDLDRIIDSGEQSFQNDESKSMEEAALRQGLVSVDMSIPDPAQQVQGYTIRPKGKRRGQGEAAANTVRTKQYQDCLQQIAVNLKTNAELMGIDTMGLALGLGKRDNPHYYGLFVQKVEAPAGSKYCYYFLNPYGNRVTLQKFSTASDLKSVVDRLGLPRQIQKRKGNKKNVIAKVLPLMKAHVYGTKALDHPDKEIAAAFQGLYSLKRLRDFQKQSADGLNAIVEATNDLYVEHSQAIKRDPIAFLTQFGATFTPSGLGSLQSIVEQLQKKTSMEKTVYALLTDETEERTWGIVMQKIPKDDEGYFVAYVINPEAGRPISFHKFVGIQSLVEYFNGNYFTQGHTFSLQSATIPDPEQQYGAQEKNADDEKEN